MSELTLLGDASALQAGELALLVLTGLLAGIVNAAVGSGALITYPVLLAIGLPPVNANGTNSFGMSFGNVSATFMFRDKLRGRRAQLVPWVVATGVGALLGALLLVALPSQVFAAVVPWLILAAVVVFIVQPWLERRIERRPTTRSVTAIVGLIGVYGGYFGAGQGIAYLAALGSMDGDDLQRSVGVKNLLAAVANSTAAVVFLLTGLVVIVPALIVGTSALVGGLAGGRLAKKLPRWLLRVVIIVVGLYAAAASFLVTR
ncbi:MAG: sulfite exporter TauE/SafE family protein [Actinomycetes bacterium]